VKGDLCRFGIADFSRGIARPDFARRYVLGDDGARSDHRSVADAQVRVGPGDDHGVRAHRHAAAQDDRVRGAHPRLGCQGDVMIDPAIVTDLDVGMNDNSQGIVFEDDTLSDRRFGRQQSAVEQIVQELYETSRALPPSAMKPAGERPKLFRSA